MAGQKREARLRADVPAIHVLFAADIAGPASASLPATNAKRLRKRA
jgi:hypothetical protein